MGEDIEHRVACLIIGRRLYGDIICSAFHTPKHVHQQDAHQWTTVNGELKKQEPHEDAVKRLLTDAHSIKLLDCCSIRPSSLGDQVIDFGGEKIVRYTWFEACYEGFVTEDAPKGERCSDVAWINVSTRGDVIKNTQRVPSDMQEMYLCAWSAFRERDHDGWFTTREATIREEAKK